MDAVSPLATQQVRSVQGIITELEAQGTPQILVLNKADAVAASAESAKAARRTNWQALHPEVTPAHVVATSARDGRGLDKLLAALEESLLALSSRIECVLPYAESALLAEVHKAGTIESEEYVEDGTDLVAYVPSSLRNRLGRACEQAGTRFEADGPALSASREKAESGAKRKEG